MTGRLHRDQCMYGVEQRENETSERDCDVGFEMDDVAHFCSSGYLFAPQVNANINATKSGSQ